MDEEELDATLEHLSLNELMTLRDTLKAEIDRVLAEIDKKIMEKFKK